MPSSLKEHARVCVRGAACCPGCAYRLFPSAELSGHLVSCSSVRFCSGCRHFISRQFASEHFTACEAMAPKCICGAWIPKVKLASHKETHCPLASCIGCGKVTKREKLLTHHLSCDAVLNCEAC